ncbi:hypothetical protein ON010_g12389 [Phytophthora cinnamomi]|nr:hypothetical protein ON010_g12389 [Phytophthora cinnamomi]
MAQLQRAPCYSFTAINKCKCSTAALRSLQRPASRTRRGRPGRRPVSRWRSRDGAAPLQLWSWPPSPPVRAWPPPRRVSLAPFLAVAACAQWRRQRRAGRFGAAVAAAAARAAFGPGAAGARAPASEPSAPVPAAAPLRDPAAAAPPRTPRRSRSVGAWPALAVRGPPPPPSLRAQTWI